MASVAEVKRQISDVENNDSLPDFAKRDLLSQLRAKLPQLEKEEADNASKSKGFVNAASEKGASRAQQLYGMDAGQIGQETQSVISGYKDRLNNVSQSKNRANSLKRQARATSGRDLSAGESAQLDRNAAFDVSSEQRRNLGDYRSLIGNIASNTGSLEMGFGNIGVANTQTPVPQPSGGTVICTELNRQGILSDYLYEKDSEYGNSVNIETWYGYYIWAQYVAKAMRKSSFITAIISPFALYWAKHIGGEKNIIGAIILNIGLPICTLIGKTAKLLKRELV